MLPAATNTLATEPAKTISEWLVGEIRLANVLGVLGFALSLFLVLRNKPKVDARASLLAVGSDLRGMRLDVLNVGSQAVTVAAIGSGRTPFPGTMADTVSALKINLREDYVTNSPLPRVVPAHEARTWHAPMEWVASAMDPSGLLHLRVEWYRPKRWWQRGVRSRTDHLLVTKNIGRSWPDMLEAKGAQ